MFGIKGFEIGIPKMDEKTCKEYYVAKEKVFAFSEDKALKHYKKCMRKSFEPEVLETAKIVDRPNSKIKDGFGVYKVGVRKETHNDFESERQKYYDMVITAKSQQDAIKEYIFKSNQKNGYFRSNPKETEFVTIIKKL